MTDTTTHRRSRAAVVALVVTALAVMAAPAVDAKGKDDRPRHLRGTFTETAAGRAAGYDISGKAHLKVNKHGTRATVKVEGLNPALQYPAHLHNGSCASGGGGHYQNVENGATTPPNELWLSSTADPMGKLIPNAHGTAHGKGSATWRARLTSSQTNARSIVVHAHDSPTRIACADLN